MSEQLPGRNPQVNVSGPATVDGERLTGRQRAIVAALAFHGEAGVTTDVLIDIVWGGTPPKAARQSLQNQITRLRRCFGPDLVRTDKDGYRLGCETDLGAFQRLVGNLFDGPVSGDLVGRLEQALENWHGLPYSDLAEFVPVEAERYRLAELHAQTEEHLAASRLAAGDHARAISDLTGMVTEEPYRDRRWILLVLANHLAGRQAEALAAYDRAVSLFSEDLRACPSALLTLLRDRIAAGETIQLADLEDVHETSDVSVGEDAPTARASGPGIPAHRRQHPARCRRGRGQSRHTTPKSPS
ncbi:MAG: winged helix-turn-helix domain-containing protein [Acidimicrobiales bacterium]|nr:winged helix-turn-helix domain-containing protein [Acidimicrobiales bacterium]